MSYPPTAHSARLRFQMQSLEPRLLLTTPGEVLTKAIRQSVLDGFTLSVAQENSLQSKLNNNQLSTFDQQLMDYMIARSNVDFFFDNATAPTNATYISTNLGTGSTITNADAIRNHFFPQQSDSSTYDVNEGTTIDWTSGAASSNAEYLHALNRHGYWQDLAQAYRFTGSTTYSTELQNQLASWSLAYPTLGTPATWSATDQKSWLLDSGIRAESWAWSYFMLLGSTGWSKEANTLMLYKMQQQLSYLGSATTYGFADNRTMSHAKGWLYLAQMLPEVTDGATQLTNAQALLFNALDGQFYDDGSHHEQSPGYANGAIEDLVEAKRLQAINGVSWPGAQVTQLTNAVESYYEILTPDGYRPALGDTYRQSSATTFLKANLALGVTTWPAAKPRGRDVWLFGAIAVNPFLGNANFPTPGTRPTTYAMEDSGNYVFRSGSDTNARQILFDAGPKGGEHGHRDLLSFELFGYGKALISDPGLVNYSSSDPNRQWALSTKAHNTVNADDLNVGALDDIGTGAPGVVVDSYDADLDAVTITAHHHGYNGLTGKPVIARSMWYDYDGTVLIVDRAEANVSHKFNQTFLIPGQNKTFDLNTGLFRTTNPTGGNVKIQALLQSGQAATRLTKFTSNTANDGLPSAQQWVISQTGTFAYFVTLITAYDGASAPNITASLLTANPTAGQMIQVQLTKNGTPQTISFAPPTLERLGANAQNNGSYADVAYDTSGNLHLTWYDRVRRILKYSMRDTSNKWSIAEIVDNGYLTGSNPAIAVDGNGHPGIAYTNGNAGDLKYAFFDGTQWNIQVVDARGSTGHYPSLAYSRSNGPVITYYDNTKGDLRMAASSGAGGFTLQTIDSGSTGAKDVGRFSHLVLDPDRTNATKWAIGYEDSSAGFTNYAIQGALNGGTQLSNGYTIFRASPFVGGYISLAFDGNNRPSLSHYDYVGGDLRFAKSSGSTLTGGISFAASVVANKGTVGSYTSHYYDSTGKAVILYFDKSKNKLNKARLTTSWAITSLADGGRESHVSKFGTSVAYTNVDDTSLRVLFM